MKSPANILTVIVIGLFAVVPFLAPALGEPFYVLVFARIMIWAIAAVSLNLIMGYGGMISFGHAVYLGIGGYAIGILSFHGINSAWIQWPAAIGACAVISLIFGAISLRTRGVYFIMITLALAQMLFFLSVSAERYGSDDGLNILSRSDFGVSFFSLEDNTTMYYTIFAFLLASVFISWKLVHSRFGVVMRATKSNETRVEAVGVSTYRYRLTAFVIAGVMCGIAGLLQANFERFVSPDMMNWPRSGELIFMVVLGGMSTLFGPVTGAFVFLMLSEILSTWTIHWHIIFGPFLVLVVIFARGGIHGLLTRGSDRE
ncbi:MAG: branched-chain amino acid ABC transporter permease [Rhodospirillaceae bacterium]|nr:branched-chain amino acid ABC transporter permease [Rhodospirillaceae bacterium]MBT5944199.1 branched-chain amino acid ABC transporter permease [Rhodospirillaceae bacterium]MBT6536557.1 branched-chain amino acid ABC transporter permease [Rhodospirillaceae bacterium]MBT7361951.1 branched-chain amino acid ABC transporter permease [Rhodospirillaceae bacterium]